MNQIRKTSESRNLVLGCLGLLATVAAAIAVIALFVWAVVSAFMAAIG